MTVPSPVQHQSYQPFPRLSTPFVDPGTGALAHPWQRLLISMWNKLGKAASQAVQQVYLQVTGTSQVQAFQSSDASLIGTLAFVANQGGPAQGLNPGASPFTYQALVNGTLVVFAGKVEVSRDQGVTWLPVSLNGGAVPLLLNDQARVTWFEATPPSVTWLPSS